MYNDLSKFEDSRSQKEGKMRAEQSKFMACLKTTPCDESDTSLSKQEVELVTEESTPVCSLCQDPDAQSPLFFLVLLQKSRLTSFTERGPPSWEDSRQLDNDILITKEGTSDPSGEDSSSPMEIDPNEVLEFAYDIEPAQVEAFVDFFRDRLLYVGNFQLSNVSDDTGTTSKLSLELMENDIYESVKGELLNRRSPIDALDTGPRCSTSHIAEGLKGRKNIVFCA